ncbi:MAG: 1-phosphofructokinase [Anaerolineae bacterium]|nr:1-phosphofructokinase [Anaerolineae bacterium]
MIFTVTLNPALDRELTIPAFKFDTVLRAAASRTDYGGKGVNVSRALDALQTPSVATGFVGGPAGARLVEGLQTPYITTDFVRVAGETRTNISIVDKDYTKYIKVNEPGPIITPEEQAALKAKVHRLARPGDWWVLSGGLPPGVAPGFYAELISIVQQAGARAVLDTGGEVLRWGCDAGAFLVKPNREEASALVGVLLETVEDLHSAVRVIHALGAQHVAVSLGKEGALLSDGEIIWTATPPAIQERNPIGAGDALVAGLVRALSQGEALPAALRRGVACGAAAASLDGTAMGTQEQVAALVEQVTIRSMPLR